jgi:hypothetical protein
MLATMARDLKTYIGLAVKKAGSDVQLGQRLGLADGSRISLWKRDVEGQKPSPLTCARLAAFTGDDPLTVLRLAGHTELADLLEGHVGGESTRKVRAHLSAALTALDHGAQRPRANKGKR